MFRPLLMLGIFASCLYAGTFDIREFGAVGDGKTLNTRAVQQAIDRCSETGGTVLVSGGDYVIGTIFLKDNVNLYVETGASLLGSLDINDYAEDVHKNMYKNEKLMDRCLIFARDARSISISGRGLIDGRGHVENFPNEGSIYRPMLIRFLNCHNIRMRDITLKNPASWTSAWLYCSDIVVDGITIVSRANKNGDGLDFDGCSDVRVSNSSFDTSDDSICLQTSLPDKPCRDVVITNCTFTSKWAGMRIGLLSRGDFESVTVTNCTFRDIDDSGLKIQMNEGGEMKNMTFSNLVMKNVPRPIFMTFCQQRACVDAPEELAPMKAMHHFIFSGIIVDNSDLDKNAAFFLTGMPGHYIEDVVIRDVQMTVSGGGTGEDAAREIKEYTPDVLAGWWPEFYLVGTLPAYGIYARHIDGLVLENINVNTLSQDLRPPVVLDDVPGARVSGVFGNGSEFVPE